MKKSGCQTFSLRDNTTDSRGLNGTKKTTQETIFLFEYATNKSGGLRYSRLDSFEHSSSFNVADNISYLTTSSISLSKASIKITKIDVNINNIEKRDLRENFGVKQMFVYELNWDSWL